MFVFQTKDGEFFTGNGYSTDLQAASTYGSKGAATQSHNRNMGGSWGPVKQEGASIPVILALPALPVPLTPLIIQPAAAPDIEEPVAPSWLGFE